MIEMDQGNHRRINIPCRNLSLQLGQRTLIMGILNVTPDSFSDGGEFISVDAAVEQAKQMAAEGADIIDVGGESTRPGSEPVQADEEEKRVVPVIKRLVKELRIPISVDTYKASVAHAAFDAGAHILNDVWGLQKDPNIAAAAAKFHAPVIVMHNQNGTEYSEDMMKSIRRFLQKSIDIATSAGIPRNSIILDPGIGFGKTAEQNMDLMKRLSELNDFGLAILLGTSRKSMLGKILDLPAKDRLHGTLATSALGIAQGIDILRVHDVKENKEAAQVCDAIVRGYRPWIQ